jgi:hypothetical protein
MRPHKKQQIKITKKNNNNNNRILEFEMFFIQKIDFE